MIPLVRAIHAAGVGLDTWPPVLERIRLHLDARVVTLGHHEFMTGFDSALIEAPEGSRFACDMVEFASRNPWFLSSADYVPGRVMTGADLISDHELRRSDFYRGFLRPRGLLHLVCGVVEQRPQGVHLLSAYRSESQAPFDEQTKAELAILLDHLTLALQGQWRWQEASELSSVLLALLEHDAHPAILVTADAEPVYCNPAAKHLLEQRQGLCLDKARLAAANMGERRLLSETIAHVARDVAAEGAATPAVLTLASAAPQLPVVVVVRAVGMVFRRESGTRQGLVKVSVRVGHGGHDPATCVFARQFELTVAQAKVSALVFAGHSLPSMARSLNLSENTVRSHLKQIFQKTETHGQMELVHLHARVCHNP